MNTLAVSAFIYLFMSFLSINDYLKYDDFIATPFDDSYSIKTFVNEDSFYYCQRNVIQKDSLLFFDFHMVKENRDYPLITIIPKSNNNYPNIRSLLILDFAVSETLLTLLTFDNLYIYQINSDKTLSFKNSVPIEKTKKFDKIFLDDNHLILVNELYSSMVDTNKKNVYIAKLNDFNSTELLYEYIYQNDYSSLTMFQPRKIATYDIMNNLFFVSEILDYKIRIFQDTTLVDSISMDMPTWDDTLANKIKNKIKTINSQGFVQAKEIISQLQEDLSNANLIQSIQYLKDDRLLVIWEEPSKLRGINLHFDLWEKINNKWAIKHHNITVPKYNRDNKLSRNSFLPNSIFDVFDCGKLVCSTNYSLDRFDTKYFNMNAAEFHTLCENDLETKELKTYYYIFKLNFDK